MEEMPDISLVLVIPGFSHLAVWTIDSIKEQLFENYEIIIVEKGVGQRELQYLKEYTGDKLQTMIMARSNKVSAMLNEGFKIARGKYVHFLFPGDIFLSKYAFSHLQALLQEKEYPDLLCFSFVQRDGINPPEVITRAFSLSFLRRGKIPTRLDACWFSKNLLVALKGFDERYEYREGFDLMCRIFLNKSYRVVYSRRVLTDYEFHKKSAYAGWQYALETLEVIYRNFGFWKTFMWVLVQDHFHLLKIWWRTIQQIYWQH